MKRGSVRYIPPVSPQQVARCAETTNQRSALHTSEWVTSIGEDDLQHNQQYLDLFENVAVVVVKKV